MNTMPGLCGESTVGVFQKNRNASPAGGSGTTLDANAAARAPNCACAAAVCWACAPWACGRGARGRMLVARALPQIEARHGAVLRLGVDDRPVGRILLRVEAVAAADAEPVGVQDAAAGSASRSARTTIRCPAGRRTRTYGFRMSALIA